MSDAKMSETWSENQMKYIEFLARGKKDMKGNGYTEEEFAKAIGVDPRTTYRWRKLPGFAVAVFEETLKERIAYIPTLVDAQIMAAGKKGKGGDTQAFMALMRQFELLKSDKSAIDHTTNGKDIPAPILGGNTQTNG